MVIVQPDSSEYIEDIDGVDIQIKMDDTAYFVDALITNLYSRREESFIRELTSNAYDASVGKDIDAPIDIFVYYDAELGSNVFEIRDYGHSMTVKDMYKIYNTLGESTSNGDVRKIGAFGIGSKSPLAYTNYFFLTTRHASDNKKHTWMFSKYKDALPKLSLLSSTDLEEGEQSGTTVKVPLHEETYLESFKETILSTTAYFPNVVYNFNIYTHTQEELNNYAIVEFDNMLLRIQDESVTDLYSFLYEPHIVCNNVWYPIDTSTVLLPEIYSNIGLKGDLNNISLIRSREDLQYTKNTVSEIYKVHKKSVAEFYNKIYKPNRVIDYDNTSGYNGHIETRIMFELDNKTAKIILHKNIVKKTFCGVRIKLDTMYMSNFFTTHYYRNSKRDSDERFSSSYYYKSLKDSVAERIINGNVVRLRRDIAWILRYYQIPHSLFLKIRAELFYKNRVHSFDTLDRRERPKRLTNTITLDRVLGGQDRVTMTNEIRYMKIPENIDLFPGIYNVIVSNVGGLNVYKYKKTLDKLPNAKEIPFDVEKFILYVNMVNYFLQLNPKTGTRLQDCSLIGEGFGFVASRYNPLKFNNIKDVADEYKVMTKKNRFYKDFINFKKDLDYVLESYEGFRRYFNAYSNHFNNSQLGVNLSLKVYKVLLLESTLYDNKKIRALSIFKPNFITKYYNIKRWLD